MDERKLERSLGRIEGTLDSILAEMKDAARERREITIRVGALERDSSHAAGRAAGEGALAGLVASGLALLAAWWQSQG